MAIQLMIFKRTILLAVLEFLCLMSGSVLASPSPSRPATLTSTMQAPNFIMSPEIQNFMAHFGKDQTGGFPFFYPVWSIGPVMHP